MTAGIKDRERRQADFIFDGCIGQGVAEHCLLLAHRFFSKTMVFKSLSTMQFVKGNYV